MESAHTNVNYAIFQLTAIVLRNLSDLGELAQRTLMQLNLLHSRNGVGVDANNTTLWLEIRIDC
jgi:hypothetical protein